MHAFQERPAVELEHFSMALLSHTALQISDVGLQAPLGQSYLVVRPGANRLAEVPAEVMQRLSQRPARLLLP
jgi:hypothetical protein